MSRGGATISKYGNLNFISLLLLSRNHSVDGIVARNDNVVQRCHDAVDMSWEFSVLTLPVDVGSVHAMSCSTVHDSALWVSCGVASVRAIMVVLWIGSWPQVGFGWRVVRLTFRRLPIVGTIVTVGVSRRVEVTLRWSGALGVGPVFVGMVERDVFVRLVRKLVKRPCDERRRRQRPQRYSS